MAVKKKSGIKKSARKAAKKATGAKKKTKKKTVAKANSHRVRPVVKRKTTGTPSSSTKISVKRTMTVEPGPPPIIVPPVEEPSRHEEAVGIVTHYYSHLGVAVVQVNKGSLRTGDTIHIIGHTTDIIQTVDSMEYEHRHVDQAEAGQSVGIKTAGHARQHDIVYLVK